MNASRRGMSSAGLVACSHPGQELERRGQLPGPGNGVFASWQARCASKVYAQR